jgi:TetR/AcrR family transcriptional regulator, mexCD-oprJ operon repressor
MPPSQPKRRVDARRSVAAIIDSARVVLAENPQATMLEIADGSGVHRNTLQRHFPSREALIGELAARAAHAFAEAVAKTNPDDGDAREAVHRAITALLLETVKWKLARYSPVGSPIPGDAQLPLRDRVTALFTRGQREGTIRDDATPGELYRSLIGLVISWNALGGDTEDPGAGADSIFRILFPAPRPMTLNVVSHLPTDESPAHLVIAAGPDAQIQVRFESRNG